MRRGAQWAPTRITFRPLRFILLFFACAGQSSRRLGRRGISRGRAAARMQQAAPTGSARQCAAAALLSSVGDGGHYPGMTAVVQPLLRLPARAVVRGHTPLLLFVASTAEALLPWAALLPAAAA
jgi:hypothetical protein